MSVTVCHQILHGRLPGFSELRSSRATPKLPPAAGETTEDMVVPPAQVLGVFVPLAQVLGVLVPPAQVLGILVPPAQVHGILVPTAQVLGPDLPGFPMPMVVVIRLSTCVRSLGLPSQYHPLLAFFRFLLVLVLPYAALLLQVYALKLHSRSGLCCGVGFKLVRIRGDSKQVCSTQVVNEDVEVDKLLLLAAFTIDYLMIVQTLADMAANARSY